MPALTRVAPLAAGLGLALLAGLTGLSLPPVAQAELFPTSIGTDLAIDGPGMFLFRDLQTGEFSVSRRGELRIDSDGYLIDIDGCRLQGFGGAPTMTERPRSDVRLDCSQCDSKRVIKSLFIDSLGQVKLVLDDDSEIVQCQILLAVVAQDAPLEPRLDRGLSGGHFTLPAEVESHLRDHLLTAGSPGVGRIRSSTLEYADSVRIRLAQVESSTSSKPIYADTSRPTDLAIQGRGWFLLRDPITNEELVTRAGIFSLDEDRYFVTPDGLRLQAQALESTSGQPLAGRQDLRCVALFRPSGSIGDISRPSAFFINALGSLVLRLSDGADVTQSQVLLTDFAHPEFLEPVALDVYRPTVAAGRIQDFAAPGQRGLGTIASWRLDLREIGEPLRARSQEIRYFTFGPITWTSQPSHLAISGYGFFVVRDPATSEQFATRSGCFSPTPEGYLALPTGHRLQGMLGPEFADAALADLNIAPPKARKAAGAEAAKVADLVPWSIDTEGRIALELPGQPGFLVGWVHLQEFRRPNSLKIVATNVCGNVRVETPVGDDLAPSDWALGDALYSGYDAALPSDPLGHAPSSNGVGFVIAGALEHPVPYAIHTPPSLRQAQLLTIDSGLLPLWSDPVVEWSHDLRTWHRCRTRQVHEERTSGALVLPVEDAAAVSQNASEPVRFYRALLPRPTPSSFGLGSIRLLP